MANLNNSIDNELLKRVLIIQRLQGMETESVSAEDPYASMEKDQLISMIHFLVKREEERAQENQELKDMVRELRETRNSLMKSVDLLSKQLADSSNEKAALLQKIDDLMSMISVNNKVRFGSTSQKGGKKKAAPVQDREKDKDEFDGTNGAAMSTASQVEPVSEEPTEQPERDYENRKGMKYQTMYADNRIVHESDRNLLPEGATIIKSFMLFAGQSCIQQVPYEYSGISRDGTPAEQQDERQPQYRIQLVC